MTNHRTYTPTDGPATTQHQPRACTHARTHFADVAFWLMDHQSEIRFKGLLTWSEFPEITSRSDEDKQQKYTLPPASISATSPTYPKDTAPPDYSLFLAILSTFWKHF